MKKPQGRESAENKLKTVVIIACLIFFSLNAGASIHFALSSSIITDTIPAPPSGPADTLTGPLTACVGDTSEYFTDIPVACHCEWSLNGVLQPDTVSPFVVVWNLAGVQTVSVVIVCENGQSSEPQSIDVAVNGPPETGPISGETEVCEYSSHPYSVNAGPSDSCAWFVNSVLQPGSGPEISYEFGSAGSYLFEVTVFNNCGISELQELVVSAQGTAPAPPGPIQGPGESCEGNTATYTTTVGAGESCTWWVDEVLQSSTSTTLQVTWLQRGPHEIEVRAVTDCGTGNPTFRLVQVFYQPVADLGNDTTIMEGESLLLDAGNPGSEYLWSTGATTQTIEVTVSGIYSVNVSNFCGEDSDSIEVTFFEVGVGEFSGNSECTDIIVSGRRIEKSTLPDNTQRVRIISPGGNVFFDGAPDNVPLMENPGIYFLQVFTSRNACFKKVFIP